MFFKRGANIRVVFVSPNFSQSFFFNFFSELESWCFFLTVSYRTSYLRLPCLFPSAFKRGANIRFILFSPNFSQSFFSISFSAFFRKGAKIPTASFQKASGCCAVIVCLLNRCRSDFFRNRWLYVLYGSFVTL